MRIRLIVERPSEQPVRILWPIEPPAHSTATNYLISDLLTQVDKVIPLSESSSSSPSDNVALTLGAYVVELGGFECLHFQPVSSVFRESDEVLIRPRTTEEIQFAARISNNNDGLYIDGVRFGSPFREELAPHMITRRTRTPATTTGLIPAVKRARRSSTHASTVFEASSTDEEHSDTERDTRRKTKSMSKKEEKIKKRGKKREKKEEKKTKEKQKKEEKTKEKRKKEEEKTKEKRKKEEEKKAKKIKKEKRLKKKAKPKDVESSSDSDSDSSSNSSSNSSSSEDEDEDEKAPIYYQNLPEHPDSQDQIAVNELVTKPIEHPSSSSSSSSSDSSSPSDSSSDSDSSSESDSDSDSSPEIASSKLAPRPIPPAPASAPAPSLHRATAPGTLPGQATLATIRRQERKKYSRKLRSLQNEEILGDDVSAGDLRHILEEWGLDLSAPNATFRQKGKADPGVIARVRQKQREEDAERAKREREVVPVGGEVMEPSRSAKKAFRRAKKNGKIPREWGIEQFMAQRRQQPQDHPHDDAEEEEEELDPETACLEAAYEEPDYSNDLYTHQYEEYDDTSANPEAWRSVIELSAVECNGEDVRLPIPDFPFHQSQLQPPKGQKARKRNKKKLQQQAQRDAEYASYERSQDKSYYADADDGDVTLDYGDDSTPVIPATVEYQQEKEAVDEDGFPAMPKESEIAVLPTLSLPVKIGTVFVFKVLTMDASTQWQPVISSYRLAKVTHVRDSSTSSPTLECLVPKSDRAVAEYDEETGQRIYGKFEMPDDEEDDGWREWGFGELLDAKIVIDGEDSQGAVKETQLGDKTQGDGDQGGKSDEPEEEEEQEGDSSGPHNDGPTQDSLTPADRDADEEMADADEEMVDAEASPEIPKIITEPPHPPPQSFTSTGIDSQPQPETIQEEEDKDANDEMPAPSEPEEIEGFAHQPQDPDGSTDDSSLPVPHQPSHGPGSPSVIQQEEEVVAGERPLCKPYPKATGLDGSAQNLESNSDSFEAQFPSLQNSFFLSSKKNVKGEEDDDKWVGVEEAVEEETQKSDGAAKTTKETTTVTVIQGKCPIMQDEEEGGAMSEIPDEVRRQLQAEIFEPREEGRGKESLFPGIPLLPTFSPFPVKTSVATTDSQRSEAEIQIMQEITLNTVGRNSHRETQYKQDDSDREDGEGSKGPATIGDSYIPLDFSDGDNLLPYANEATPSPPPPLSMPAPSIKAAPPTSSWASLSKAVPSSQPTTTIKRATRGGSSQSSRRQSDIAPSSVPVVEEKEGKVKARRSLGSQGSGSNWELGSLKGSLKKGMDKKKLEVIEIEDSD